MSNTDFLVWFTNLPEHLPLQDDVTARFASIPLDQLSFASEGDRDMHIALQTLHRQSGPGSAGHESTIPGRTGSESTPEQSLCQPWDSSAVEQSVESFSPSLNNHQSLTFADLELVPDLCPHELNLDPNVPKTLEVLCAEARPDDHRSCQSSEHHQNNTLDPK